MLVRFCKDNSVSSNILAVLSESTKKVGKGKDTKVYVKNTVICGSNGKFGTRHHKKGSPSSVGETLSLNQFIKLFNMQSHKFQEIFREEYNELYKQYEKLIKDGKE